MDDLRSKPCYGNNMQIEPYKFEDFISYTSSSQTHAENTNTDPAVDFKKVKSGSISRIWSLSDPEMQRKKRVASYKAYTVEVNSRIHYAITRNVQEIDLRIMFMGKYKYCDDELFFNNSCLVSIKVSRCVFNPPNGAIRWDKLKFLCIDGGELDGDLIGTILSGSPCLKTLELNECDVDGRIAKSLFGNFGVLERLSCEIETYKRISDDDELFLDDLWPAISMKLSRCVFDPPNGVIRLDEDVIGTILSESPFLETLQLSECCGFRRIDVTSKSVKNLVLSGYGY
ncbi:ribonuclease H-like domain-containing protein, partial [Tanacetum coccineum]